MVVLGGSAVPVMVRKLNLVLIDSPARSKIERPLSCVHYVSTRVFLRLLSFHGTLRLTIGSSGIPHSPLSRRSYQDRQPSSMMAILRDEYVLLVPPQCASFRHLA